MARSVFQPGNPGGPGRPRGSRNKLAEAFLEVVYADFQAHGAAAIEAARHESPLGCYRMVASLLPQKVEVEKVADKTSDAELLAIIRGAARTAEDGDGDHVH